MEELGKDQVMPQRLPIDWSGLRAVAPRKVVTRRELLVHGVSPRTIARRVHADGPWMRLLPGVYVMQSGEPTWQQRAEAALRYAGRTAMITGLHAARLQGLRRLPSDPRIHVLVPHKTQPNSYGYVTVERTERLPQPLMRHGLPLAPVVRAVLDCTRRMTDAETVQSILAESVQRGLVTPRELRTELDAGTTRGTALPRRLLRDVAMGVRSVSEGDALRLVARSGLPTPRWNVPILGPNGRRIAVIDAWFDDVALAWEIDSFEFHLSPRDYALTMRRHNELVAEGIVVVHTLPSDIRRRPHQVIANLRAAYQQAALRPRPPVRAIPAAA
ncbi:MAG: hypothetical protein ACRDQB_07915 [Thermocrispum sp.]